MPDRVSRRSFLRNAAMTAAAVAWARAFRVHADAGAVCAVPPDFPAGMELYRQAYRNWAGEVAVDDVLTCAPRTASQIPAIAEWARAHDYRIRAQGMRRGWSPLTVSKDVECEGLVLVDTTQHLTSMRLNDGVPASVTVEAGAQMEPCSVTCRTRATVSRRVRRRATSRSAARLPSTGTGLRSPPRARRASRDTRSVRSATWCSR